MSRRWSPCTSSTGGRDVISAAKASGVDVLRHDQHAGIADDRGRRDRAAQADMQRHHGALAEKPTSASADGGSLRRCKLGIEKRIERRRGRVDAGPALVRIAERQRKPFAARRRLPARARRVRRHERGVGQQACQARPMSIRSLPSAP